MSEKYIRRTQKQWAAIIDQQANSGLQVKEFCKQRKLGLSTFCKWKQKLLLDSVTQPNSSSSNTPAFEPVKIVADKSVALSPATRISLTLDEDITLTIERAPRS